jgi:AraC-like DNA-binding protein
MSEHISDFFQRKLELKMYGFINIDKPLKSSQTEHEHNFWQINLACSGDIFLGIDNCRQKFCAGDIVIIPPGVRHYLDYSKTKHYSGFSFKFDLWVNFSDKKQPFSFIHTDENSRQLIVAITNLFNGFFPPSMRWQNRQFTVTSAASYPMLMEDILFGTLRYFYFIKPASRNDGELFFKMREIIAKHSSDPVSVENMARELCYSAGHLRLLVKMKTGKTTKTFIDEERIKIAKHYLQYSNLNVSEVAGRMGFCDVLYFGKFFKKYVQITPNNYRKQCRIVLTNSHIS